MAMTRDERRDLQFITSPSGEEMVVLPRAIYDRLIAAVEGKIKSMRAVGSEGDDKPDMTIRLVPK